MSYTDLNLYIDGEFTKGNSGASEDVVNPSTDAVLATLPHAKKEEMDKAVAAAAEAFKTWRKTPAVERSKILRKAADLMRERADTIATSLTMEQGKVLAEAKMEVMACAEVIEWFAEEGRRAYGRIIPARADGVRNMVTDGACRGRCRFLPLELPCHAGSPEDRGLARQLAAPSSASALKKRRAHPLKWSSASTTLACRRVA